MATKIVMPKQGNTVETVVLLEWKKEVGDQVEEGDPLCEVETDKATFEVPSTDSGVLLRKLYAEGDDVAVMQEFAVVGAPDEEVAEEPEAQSSTEGEAAPAQAAKGPAPSAGAAAGAPQQPVTPANGDAASVGERPLTGRRDVRISPLARATAARLGVPETRYAQIPGSGPGGRIIKSDVTAFAEGQPAETAGAAAGASAPSSEQAPLTVGQAEVAETVSVTGVRKVISERMLASLTQTAQLTLNATAEATQLLGYRKKLKGAPESLGVADITLNDILMFVVARIVARHPALNAHYVEGNPDEIRRFRGVNLGFAVDAQKGLYVPVIRGADRLSLRGLADRAHDLAAAVHAGKAGPDELSGATFTVTNLGAFGVRDFTAVLNPPEVGILGIGSVRPEQMYRGEEVVTAPHIGLSLTFDHRATDGGPAARLLQDVTTAIGNAESMLAI